MLTSWASSMKWGSSGVYFYYILLDKNGDRKEDKQAIKKGRSESGNRELVSEKKYTFKLTARLVWEGYEASRIVFSKR